MSESIKIQKVGKYFLSEKLGGGTMGSVWLSQHPGLGMPVAVKLLNMELAAQDPDYLNRFMQEGRLAGQLMHKNIVRTYDAGMENNRAYIVMEYIEGCDALELLEARGALPPDEVLALGLAIGEALEEAHSMGIVHRDIKPDNILATNDGKIKLADLGLAKKVDDSFGSTMAGTALGTPYYMSPEQALDALKSDARSDIYSLGATLYHLLTGTLPYGGDNVMGVMLRHTNEPLDPPQNRKEGLPLEFCKVICKMMEKDPAKRYQSCTEMLEDFNKLKYGSDDLSVNEKQLTKQLASSKSGRIKMKVSNGAAAKSMRQSPSSKSRTKKAGNSTAYVSLAAVVILLIVLIPSIMKKRPVDLPEKKIENVTKIKVEEPVIVKKEEPKEEKPVVVEPVSEKPELSALDKGNAALKNYKAPFYMEGVPMPPTKLVPALLDIAAGKYEAAKEKLIAIKPELKSNKTLKRQKHLLSIIDAQEVVYSPFQVEDSIKECVLSDYKWSSASVGFKKPARNQYVLEGNKDLKILLEIDKTVFRKGLYAHPPSKYTYQLNGKWETFETRFGLRDGAYYPATFKIIGDGKELFSKSGVGKKTICTATVEVKGIQTLELVTEFEVHKSRCWAIWVAPVLKRN